MSIPAPEEVRQSRHEEAIRETASPSEQYLRVFREHNFAKGQEDPEEVWVYVVPGRECSSFQSPRPDVAAARAVIASAGWKLSRSTGTGIRDGSWWEIWRPATQADDPSALALPGEVKGVAGE